MTTTIYLDVDGVLNAVNRSNPSPAVSGWAGVEWETAPINGYPIRWSKQLIAALNELAARDDVTFKWLTTWEDDAAKILAPAIGIKGQEWDVLHGDQHAWGGKRGWWKLEAIRADVEATQPEKFVWIDDDLSMEYDACDWLVGRTEGLGVSPFMRDGLTRYDVESITAFINAEAEVAV